MAGNIHKQADKMHFQQTQHIFSSYLRNPEKNPRPQDVEVRRMNIYRDLFYNNIEGFISSGFPVLREITTDESWHAMVRDFMNRHSCHVPYFLEIASEFLNYLQNIRDVHNDPPFILELAHYEWVELALDVAEENEPDQQKSICSDDDLLSACPIISPLAWNLSYHYPVHCIGPHHQPQIAPETATFLLVYRDQDDEVQFIEQNNVSARLLQLLLDDDSLTGLAALQMISDEMQHPNPQLVIDGGLQTLSEYHRLGIILGVSVCDT